MSVKRVISVFSAAILLAGAHFPLSAESFQVRFPVGKSSLDTSYTYNIRACARVREALSAPGSGKITVTAYSSPDGKYSRNKQLTRLRAASVTDFLYSLPDIDTSRVSLVLVNEDWEGVKSYLKRSNKEWKQDALDIINSSTGDKKALLQDLWVGEAWEDLLKNCFPALRRVSVEVEESASQPAQGHIEGPEIIFNQGSSNVPSSVFSQLKELAKTDSNTLYIYIKASPEGTEAGNQKLSMRRAEAIEALLRQYGYTGSVGVQYRGEDWAGLLEAVKSASDMPEKDYVIDILSDKTLDRDSRKKSLQAVCYGRTWLRLMDTEMAGLRKAVVSPYMIL